jgi:glutaredoxin
LPILNFALRRIGKIELNNLHKARLPLLREYYTQQGKVFEDRNAQDNLEYRKEMLSFSDGDPTVPVIVENGRLKQIGWEGRG